MHKKIYTISKAGWSQGGRLPPLKLRHWSKWRAYEAHSTELILLNLLVSYYYLHITEKAKKKKRGRDPGNAAKSNLSHNMALQTIVRYIGHTRYYFTGHNLSSITSFITATRRHMGCATLGTKYRKRNIGIETADSIHQMSPKKIKSKSLSFNFISLTANFGSITEELRCPEKIRKGIPLSI